MSEADLDRRLAAWVADGIVTEEQAAAIRAHEARAASGASPRAGIPILAEILGYVGSLLAVGAILALMDSWWDRLGTLGHVGLPGIVAVAALAGGFALGRIDAPSARRLEQFLLFLGVAATGFAGGIVVRDACCAAAPSDPATAKTMAWTNLAGYAVASVVGAVVYRLRRTALQQLACGVAVAGTCIAVGVVGEDSLPHWISGALLIVFALAWGALSHRERLQPSSVGLALASLALLVGIVFTGSGMGEGPRKGVLVAGLLASIGLIVLSLLLRRGVVLGFGAAGVVLFVPLVLAVLFGNTIGVPIAVLLTGVLLVAMSVLVAFVLPRMRRGAP